MHSDYYFTKTSNIDELSILKNEWLATLVSPQDGMWAFFRDNAIHWSILSNKEIIGYAAIDESNQLLQFYISPKYQLKASVIFKAFLSKMKIKTGIVGTNNISFLSIVLSVVKDSKISTYLFRNHYEVNVEEKEGILKEGDKEDIDSLVEFYYYSMGAPREWLSGYIGGLIAKNEIFSLEINDKIIGTCEVRKSLSAPGFADIGMVVSPDFRRKGYGTYLLSIAKKIALEQENTPICSCEKDNVGSIKSIHNCGFVSYYQLLTVDFE